MRTKNYIMLILDLMPNAIHILTLRYFIGKICAEIGYLLKKRHGP